MTTARVTDAGSGIVSAVEAIWHAVRERHGSVPPAVIQVASGRELQRVRRHGHWAASRWRVTGDDELVGEVFIAAERFSDGEAGVLATVLHEAAHALAFVRDVRDTSRGGRYHNKRFKVIAEGLGLGVEQGASNGWSRTTAPAAVLDEYHADLAPARAMVDRVRRESAGGRPLKRRATRCKLVCDCGRAIMAAHGVAALGAIYCTLCGSAFVDPVAAADAAARQRPLF